MELFTKINYSLRDFEPEKLRGDLNKAYGNFPNSRISYYLIKDLNYFRSLCSRRICKITADALFFIEITGKGYLMPHRDHNVSCCLNYYFEPNGSTTFFHKQKLDSEGFKYPGEEKANIYDLDQIDTIGEFTAKKNDCYLLNVNEIHSVLSHTDGVRRIISWQWKNASFQEILNNINH